MSNVPLNSSELWLICTIGLPCFSRSRKPYVQAASERLQDDHVRRTHVGQLGRTKNQIKRRQKLSTTFFEPCFANTLKLRISILVHSFNHKVDSFSCLNERYPVHYERRRHRTGTSRSHLSNIAPERLAERDWYPKS